MGALASLCALIVTGCGLELISTVGRLGSSGAAGALPSWPVEMKVGLGEASLAVSKLAESSADLPLTEEADHTYSLRPDPKEIPAFRIAESLTVPATSSVLPDTSAPMPSLDPGPLAGPGLSLASLNLPIAYGPEEPDLALPVDQAFTPKDQSEAVSLGDLRGGKLDAGSSVTLAVTSDLGGADRDKVELALHDLTIASEGVVLNRTWRAANPSASLGHGATIVVQLDEGKVIRNSLTISFGSRGTLRAGLRIRELDDSQHLATTLRSTLKIKEISLPAQALPSSTQSIGALRVPESPELHSISDVTIASGSLALTVTNGFGLNARLNLDMTGIKDAQGLPLAFTAEIPAGPPSQSRHVIPLAGASLTGEPLSVSVSGFTYDTEAGVDRLPVGLGPLPGGMAPFSAAPTMGARVEVSELVIDSVKAVVKKTLTVATSSTPVALPEGFTRAGIALKRVSLALSLDNRSHLSGAITPTISAVLKDGSTRALDYRGDRSFAPSETRGITRTTVLDINEGNSNLADLLNAGVTSLISGAEVAIDTRGVAVPLTRDDQVSGKVSIAVPLSLVFKEMGPGKANPAYDITPATPLTLDAGTKERLAQGQIERLAIAAEVDNGLRIPLDINLLFSKQDDPFNDPAPLVRTLSLGDGTATARSLIDFSTADIPFFKDARTVGLRLTSPGTNGQPVAMKSTDALRVRLVAMIKARVSAKAFGQ
ncbi:MAG TPA: hypothetical protein V6D00_09990 [Pantanalinema sp.]